MAHCVLCQNGYRQLQLAACMNSPEASALFFLALKLAISGNAGEKKAPQVLIPWENFS